MVVVRTVPLALFAALFTFAADNTLTPAERKEGFTLLFDGKTFRNWQDPGKKNRPGDAWLIESGTLKTRLQPTIEEDLLTEKQYGDFELRFDWKLSPNGNTGLKYRLQQAVFVDPSKNPRSQGFERQIGTELSKKISDRSSVAADADGFQYTVGFEYQLIDDAGHPDARRGADRRTGSLYSMIAPEKEAAKVAGEWNSSRLIVRGDRFQHWLNGTKVAEGSLKDPRVREGVEKRWKDVPEVREMLINPKPEGYIALQHHGDEVWFKNLRIRELQ